MNKLFIIGNGFDLAHGLNTRYSDFLLWYLKIVVKELSKTQDYSDNLMKVHYDGTPYNYEINTISDFRDFQNTHVHKKYNPLLSVECNDFFRDIIDKHIDTNWVDIECHYYKHLLELYQKSASHLHDRNQTNRANVKSLNNCMNAIKIKLSEYLRTLETAQPNPKLLDFFQKEIDETCLEAKIFNTPPNIQFLIFNYTTTLNLYNSIDLVNNDILQYNYIHGVLTDIERSIVFGYGDETDEHYSKIESLNVNEYLDNIKSFSYLKTDNYLKLASFIDTTAFDVYIMGHSCGLSDRVLLKSIFEHENCKSIKIFYHKRKDNSNDFFVKTLEISRHFNAELKDKMRRKIVPFEKCIPLEQN